MIPSKRTANVFVAIYVTAFCLGLIGLFLLPKEEITSRRIALGMIFLFGPPVVVTVALWFLRKVGVWNGK